MSPCYRHRRIGELGEGQHGIELLIWQCSKKGMDFKSGFKGDKYGLGERRLFPPIGQEAAYGRELKRENEPAI